jgi:hypothetical protein
MAANLINRISRLFHGNLSANRCPRRSRCTVTKSLEQRRLLSAAPRVQSLSPADIEATTSATWNLQFSEPVTGVDMTDFRVTPDVGVTWQSTVILCVAVPGSFSNLCGPRVLPCITKSRSLRILTGNNEGQFFPGQLIDLPNTIFAPVQVLLAGDVNKDGLNDLLFRETSRTDDGIINYRGHVMLGTIPGELVDTGVFFEGPENNGGITRLFDMDGDLNPDLITTNQDLGLCVYPGMGDGTFAAPIPVGFDGSDRVRINPFEIVITSDGDATSNLLLFSTAIDPVSGYQQDVTRVTLFQQNAAGQYQLASQLDVAGSVVPLKRTGLQSRLNSQHGLELRVSRYDKSTEQTSILFQRLDISPTGQLSSSQILSLPGRIDQTADGDFDGDGITDTVFVGDSPYGSLDSTGITLLLRNPAQQSGDPVRATISRGEGAGNRPSALLAADIDGDSALDVLSVSQSTNTLNLSRGLGTGLFLPTQRFSVGQGPVGVATLDFNHDGLQDAVTANSLDGTLTFLKNMGNGVLQRDSDLAVGAGVSAVTVADYNGDGLADLAVALPENAGVAVLYGTTAGTFLAPQYTSTAPGAGRLANGDLNADGLPDLVVGSATQGSVHVLLGSSGGLQPGATLFYSSGLHNLIVDDMNQDGISDILVMTENREVLISNGLGGGNFTPPELMLYYYSGTAQLSVGDLNGAGPDLVVLSSYVLSTFFEFRTANAVGYFTKVGEQQVEHEPRTFAIGDFTGDGRQDLVAADFQKDGLRMFKNTGNGSTYGDSVTVVTNLSPRYDAIAPIQFLEDTKQYRVPMTGITPGLGEEQLVRVVVHSTDSPDLLPVPQFLMSADQTSGEFILLPKPAASGFVTVWFYLEDSGDDGDFETWQDNGYTSWQQLKIDVTPIRAKLWTPSGPTQEQRPFFAWTDVPGAYEFRIWITNSSTGAHPQVLTTSLVTAWQPEQDLGIGKFDVWIQAVKADGTRLPWSLKSSFEINTGVFIDPLPARIANARPTVNWAPVPGADAYEVYVSNLSTGQGGVIREFVTTNKWTPAQDMDLSKYRIWARAVIRGKYNARWSGGRDFTVCNPPVPVGPSVFATVQRPEFRWGAVSGASTYGFQLRNTVTGKVVVDVRGLTTPQFTPAGPIPFGKYRWWAIAESATGIRSDWSTGVDLIVSDKPILLSPSGTVSGQNLKLTWMAFPGAVSWEVWLNRSQPQQFIVSASSLTQTEYVVPVKLVSGVTYRFWTRAVTGDNRTTQWSQPMEFTVASSEAAEPGSGEESILSPLQRSLPIVTTSLPQLISGHSAVSRRAEPPKFNSRQQPDDERGREALTAAAVERSTVDRRVPAESPLSSHGMQVELVGDAILQAIAELDRSV